MAGVQGFPCWYELAAGDTDRAGAFYAAVLGWAWIDSGTPGMTYLLARHDGAQVAGMMRAQSGQPIGWTIYFAVQDCDATVAEAAARGARVLVAPADIPGTGRFAVLCDPQGAGFALLQPLDPGAGGAFDQRKTGHGNWNELITPDPLAALAFYGALFGWTNPRSLAMGPEMTYHLIACDGLDIGGTFAAPGGGAFWKPYFGVAATRLALDQVPEMGGTVLDGPREVPGGALTLQIRDSEGAVLALVGPG